MTDYVLGFSVVPYGSSLVGAYLIPGTDVTLSLRKEVAPLLVGLAKDFNDTVEPLIKGQCGGHNPRKIAGTSVWSRHAPAIAVDLNWNKHPQGDRGTFTDAQVKAIRAILKKYSFSGYQLFRWGGDYKSKPDEMHFELNVGRSICLGAVAALQKPATPPANWYKGGLGTRTVKYGMRGDDVGYIQRYIGPRHMGKDDGVAGALFVSGVKWYQQDQGITVDGIVGKETWKKLEVTPRY